MSGLWLLLRREANEFASGVKGRINKEFDIVGIILSAIIVSAMGVAVIAVFSQFIAKYSAIELYGVADKEGRVFDLLSVTYLVIVVIGSVYGALKINETLAKSSDYELLLHLPLKFSDILMSKLTVIFVKLFVFVNTLVIPCNVTVGIQAGITSTFWLSSVPAYFSLPVFAFLPAVIVALPLRYVTTWIKRSPLAVVVTYTVLIAGAVFLYSKFLLLLRGMFESGSVKFLLNENTVMTMTHLANVAYPASLAANAAIGRKFVLNLLLMLLVCAGALMCVYGISYFAFSSAVKHTMSSRGGGHAKSVMTDGLLRSLVKKEFVTVFRTPQYAFQYVAVTVTLPLIVFVCTSLFSEFVMRLIGMNFNLEICILIISMLSVVTNSFCAGNISRDGEMFLRLKTTPLSCKKIIFAKVLFCSVTNAFAIFTSCLVMWLVGFVSFSQFYFCLRCF
jgi:hypothetical protein